LFKLLIKIAGISKRIFVATVRRSEPQAGEVLVAAMATARLAAGGYGTPNLAIPRIETAAAERTLIHIGIGR